MTGLEQKLMNIIEQERSEMERERSAWSKALVTLQEQNQQIITLLDHQNESKTEEIEILLNALRAQ